MSRGCGVYPRSISVRWRAPTYRHLVSTSSRMDSTGVGMTRYVPCAYCGLSTTRFDTVEGQPLHEMCAKAGRQRDIETETIYRNQYVVAKEVSVEEEGRY